MHTYLFAANQDYIILWPYYKAQYLIEPNKKLHEIINIENLHYQKCRSIYKG